MYGMGRIDYIFGVQICKWYILFYASAIGYEWTEWEGDGRFCNRSVTCKTTFWQEKERGNTSCQRKEDDADDAS